jgi:hypothetical protein
LIDIVVANEHLQMFSNRAAVVAVGSRDTVSDSSQLTDLQIVRRTKAGTLNSRDMDEHVSAAVLGLNESIALRRVNHLTVPVAIVASLNAQT